jgi:hypothetical protein
MLEFLDLGGLVFLISLSGISFRANHRSQNLDIKTLARVGDKAQGLARQGLAQK